MGKFTPKSQLGYITGILALLALVASPVHSAHGACDCQAVLVCGADDCSASGESGTDPRQGCVSVKADIRPSSADLSICAFGDCWTGKADTHEQNGLETVWHGRMRRNDDRQFAQSSVAVYLNDGVGFAQISDESGPMQISMICNDNG